MIAIIMVASTIGIAVHTSEFVYYSQEREATAFIFKTYPTAIVFTDERLLPFVKFFVPTMSVREIPIKLSDMLHNRPSLPSLVLISQHSIDYDLYRPVFATPPSKILTFVLANGYLVYSNEGINAYELGM
jgi:hypothetical protein